MANGIAGLHARLAESQQTVTQRFDVTLVERHERLVGFERHHAHGLGQAIVQLDADAPDLVGDAQLGHALRNAHHTHSRPDDPAQLQEPRNVLFAELAIAIDEVDDADELAIEQHRSRHAVPIAQLDAGLGLNVRFVWV